MDSETDFVDSTRRAISFCVEKRRVVRSCWVDGSG
jgi:hypothetical protein